MGLFDQSQGLMGLGQQPQQYGAQVPYQDPQATIGPTPFGQQPQGNQPQMTFLGQPPQETSNPFAIGGGLPMPQNPNYMGQPPTQEVPNYQMPMSNDMNGFMLNDSPMGQPQGYPQPSTKFLDRYDMTPQAKPLQSFFEGSTKGQIPMGFSMVNGEMVKTGNFNEQQPTTNIAQATFGGTYAPNNTQSTTPALNPTPQPPQIFQPQPMQPSNPVNTQTVQPNFMGQTPFGQAQTGQFTSTNPFVQAAQANAQGNLGGALQATSANRVNQQTPYGSLSYQQTGTDAQGNPIWSANQQLSPELQQLTQSSLAGLQASQANPMTGINPGQTYSDAIMQRLQPQQRQQTEALDAQLANQGIMPGSEAYNRAKVLQGQTQNDALTSAIVGGMQTGLQAQGLQNTTAANIRNLATPGYVTPYNQAAVAGPDYLSAYTSQNATDIAKANADAAQRSSLLSTLGGLGSSAILGGTGANSALGGLLGLGNQGLTALGNSSLWSSLFGNNAPAITGDTNFLKDIGLAGSTYGSGTGGMLTDPLAGYF
jgi:hypothetical protein